MGWTMVSGMVVAGVIAAGAGAGLSAAEAGERLHDHVYADSFGNLVIYSRAGYKRIVVGQGHLAHELAEYTGSDRDDPNVVRLSDAHRYSYQVDCYRPPVLLKGRSYMYGLADGELPEPSGTCRR
jgi:hypothetical protein